MLSLLFTIGCFESNTKILVIIEGVVVDKDDQVPLNYAAVSITGKSISVSTDSDCKLRLSVHDVDPKDTIQVRHVGYQPLSQTISEFKDTDTDIIGLEYKEYAISEVSVKPAELNLYEFMDKAISEYNEHRRSEPHVALAHYREKATFNEKYVMFNESIGYSIFMGERENVAPFSNYKFFYDNTRMSSYAREWRPRGQGAKVFEHVPLAGGTVLRSLRVLETNGLLEPRNFESFLKPPRFRYQLDSTYHINGKLVYRIHFSPSVFNPRSTQEGTIDVFEENHRIYKIEYSCTDIWSTIFHERTEGEVSLEFQYYNEQPYLSSGSASYKKNDYNHSINFNVLLQKFDEFELDKEEFWSLNAYAIRPFIEYDPKEWREYDIEEDPDMEKIFDDLKSVEEKELPRQFIDNSGKWYGDTYSSQSQLERARSVINNLKRFF